MQKPLLKSILLINAVILQFSSYGQSDCLSDSIRYQQVYMKRTHNVIGFVPSKARVTNGWAIGWSTGIDDYCIHMDSIRINGLYTNISPFPIFVAAMTIPIQIFSPKSYGDLFRVDMQNLAEPYYKHKLRGLSISLLDFGENFEVQGFQITGLYHKMGKLSGISLTLLTSSYQEFHGIMISGISNRAYKGHGLQIGLVNIAKEMKGVQIGLWNKIGDKGFPIINVRFRSKR